MKKNTGLIFFICLIVMAMSTPGRSETIEVRHYQAQDRYAFGLKLLDLALSKVSDDYDIIGPKDTQINEARGELEIVEGRLDLEFLSTNLYRETRMIPVKIPVYRGLLGLRLLLARPEKAEQLSRISEVADLRSYTALFGTHWGDLPVFEANQLPVLTHVKYESLFQMLIAGRGDYFHRGLSEIFPEQSKYADDIVIADRVALFYEHPVYFFIGKHRPELAVAIEKGLTIALKDGSYKQLFLNEYQDVLNTADLANRKILFVHNPVVPVNTPPVDTSWWLPEGVMIR